MTITLKFLGAADTVTGSRTLITFRGESWLLDCGLFQGDKEKRQRNRERFEPDPASLSGVILTHAHLDHSGYLPKLVNDGFKGPVHVTDGTADLARILLLDAAHLEEEFADYANRTGYSNHRPAIPLYTEDDAERALSRLVRHERDRWVTLSDGLSFRFLRAGHIIGSSLVQFSVPTEHGPRILTFTGDLGNGRSQTMKPPVRLHETDVLVLESTYGDRLQERVSALDNLAAVVNRVVARGGVLVVPAFAVGRAQEVTYMLRLLEDRGRIPRVPVLLDSPMAAEATKVCLAHEEDQVFGSAFAGDGDAFSPAQFEVVLSADASMGVCMRDGPMVVISASGMLNGGRVLHHLKVRLPDERNAVLFAGYQAEGTKGRFLLDHAGTIDTLRIHHTEIPVAAEIVAMPELSSHIDWQDALDWLGGFGRLPERILLNHGEVAAQTALRDRIKERFGVTPELASDAQTIQLWA